MGSVCECCLCVQQQQVKQQPNAAKNARSYPLCATSKAVVYCGGLGGNDMECRYHMTLKGTYLGIVTIDENHIRAVVDLTSIDKCSFVDDSKSKPGFHRKLTLRSKLQPTNTKEIYFKDVDTQLGEHIMHVIQKVKQRTPRTQSAQSAHSIRDRDNDDEKAAEHGCETRIDDNHNADNVLFASYLMYRNVPYYGVLRNMKLELFVDYWCFANKKQPMKVFDILADVGDCVAEHNEHGTYFTVHRYAFDLIYKTKGKNNKYRRRTLVSFSNNDRFEFCVHIDFLLTFKCMPNEFLSSDLSRFDKTEMQKKLNKTHAPLIQEMAKIYSEYHENNNNHTKNNNNNHNNNDDSVDILTKQLCVFDALFRVWHESKTIHEYLKQSQHENENENQDANSATTDDDIFPDFQSVLQAIDVSPSAIIPSYSTLMLQMQNNTNILARKPCDAGPKCCSYLHYTRDRRNDAHVGIGNHNKNRDSARAFIRNTQESCVVRDFCKIHALLYTHNAEEEEEEEEEHKEDIGTKTRTLSTHVRGTFAEEQESSDGSDNEVYDRRRTRPKTATEMASSNMNNINDDKFIIAAQPTKDGKFGYGSNCVYWRYDRDTSSNFIFPVHISLMDEVCFNQKIPSKFCITLTQFWTFYLKALYFRNAFKHEFIAKNNGLINYIYNLEVGCLLSVHHFISLMLYSDLTVFQSEFKKYTRKSNENETEDSVHARNAFVAHWCRYLIESASIFGTDMGHTKRDLLYCGLSTPLLFDSLEQWINAPLSTTASKSIGHRFAGHTGMMLELQRKDDDSCFFPIYKVSEYPEEQERFIYGTELKITNIVWQCNSSPNSFSCLRFIRAIRLLEKVFRGQMFVDCNQKLIRCQNIQLMLDLIECYLKGKIYQPRPQQIDDINNNDINNNNTNRNDHHNDVFPNEYYEYTQNLFNNRIHQFMKVDKSRDCQTWLNRSELDRLSSDFPLLYARLSTMLSKHSIYRVYNAPDPVSCVISAGVDYERLLSLQMNEKMTIGRRFTIINEDRKHGRLRFGFEARINRAVSSFPTQCGLSLYLLSKPDACHSIDILYDIICPELQYESVNVWKRYHNVNEYDGVGIFPNQLLASVDSFSIRVCIRIVEYD